ncbi:MAG: porin [Candidatus Polarisedimenticolia bacterium]
MAWIASLVATTGALAQQTPPEKRLELSGFVDTYFAWNTNKPFDHENWFTGMGTSAKRADTLDINLAQFSLLMTPDPVGFHLTLGYGRSEEVLHLSEGEENAFDNVLQASVQYQTKVGRGLLVEGGIFPSPIGMEVLQTKDDWNYTRSYLAEFSPYYLAGVKVAYPFTERWSGQILLVNGWQVITDNNRGKSIAWQVAYGGDRLTASFKGMSGPEQTDNDDDVRTLLDTVAVWKVAKLLSLGFSADYGWEERPAEDDAGWKGAALYARLTGEEWKTAYAARGEIYDDEDGAISGIPQTLRDVTGTFEYRPVDALIVKVEARWDRSTAEVFTGDEVDVAGDPLRDERTQWLFLAGVVAVFDPGKK